jgi:hypothetical protein
LRERLGELAGNEIHFLGFGYCGSYRARRAEVPDDAREIAFASGASVLLRAAALREVGAFDETLFMYQEDQDLGIRLRLAGWRARVAPRSIVWHHYAFTRSPRKFFWLERNRYLVLAKNLTARSLLVLAPFLVIAELALLPVALAGGWLPEKVRAWKALASPARTRFTYRFEKYSGCVARLSARERPPLSTRRMSSTMKRKLACSVSSLVMVSARSSGTPAFNSVESSWVKNSTSRRRPALNAGSFSSNDFFG